MNTRPLSAGDIAAIRQATNRSHPRLLWDASDRALIQDRIGRSETAEGLAAALRAKCEAYLDPAHPHRLDLEALDSTALFTRPGEHELGRIMEELAFAGWLWSDARFTARAKQIVLRRVREAFRTPEEANPDYSYCRSPLGIGLTGAPLAATLDLLRPAFTDAEWAEAVTHVRDYYLAYARRPFFARARTHSPGFNKTAYGMCAVGLLALAVAENLPDDELSAAVGEALRAAQGYLREAMDDDGGTFEGIGYGAICVHQAIQLGEALRRHGLPVLDGYEPLHRHGRWVTSLLAPGGGTVDVGDSIGPDNVFSSMLLLARWFRDPVLNWAYRRGLGRPDHVNGPYGDSFNLWLASLPTQLAWFDPDAPVQSPTGAGWPLEGAVSGYAVATLRTGWENDDVLAVLTGCGRRHTAAAHIGAEAGALALRAYGRELLADPGYGYSTADAHSTVIVSGRPPDAEGGNARFGGRLTRFAGGAAAAAAGVDVSQLLGCKWAQRDVVLVRGEQPYLIVADDLNEKDNWSEYDWFWQAPAGAALETPGSDGWARIRVGEVVLDLASLTPAPDAYPKPYQTEWFAETHRPRPWAGQPEPPLEQHRLRLHMAAYNGILLTLLVPRRKEAAGLSWRVLECPQPGVALELKGNGWSDTIVFAPYNRFLQAGACAGAGRLAVVRETGGKAACQVLLEGYELGFNGRPLVARRDCAGDVIL